jgi:hypothetical protein
MRPFFAVVMATGILASPLAQAQSNGLDSALSGSASQESARAALDALTTAVPNPVADQECLPPDAMRADVMTRLHTQVMMASLVCDGPWSNPALYEEYVDFTYRMEDLLTGAQEDMELYFRQTQSADAFDAFNTYRTALANEEAGEVRHWGAATYCDIMISRYNSLIGATPGAFEAYAEDIAGRALARVGVCD